MRGRNAGSYTSELVCRRVYGIRDAMARLRDRFMYAGMLERKRDDFVRSDALQILGRWLCIAPMMTVVVILSGCASTTPKDLDASGARALIEPSDLINVAIADADRTRVDHTHIGDKASVESYSTGPQWARIFVGRVGKEPLFAIRETKLRFEVSLYFRARYSIDGVLTYGGRDWPISVEGTWSSWWPSDDTVAAAVHEGIVKAAAACRAIISRGTEGR